MGPVMGITFGSRVLDWNLALRSMWNEFLSLLLAVLIGAIIGVCTSFCPVAENWPTEQMSSRGDTAGLVTGIAIAIPRYVPATHGKYISCGRLTASVDWRCF